MNRPMSRILLVFASLLLGGMIGCEGRYDATSPDKGSSPDDTPTDSPATNATPTATADANELAHGFDIASCQVKGSFDFRHAVITTALTGCRISGGNVTLSWTRHTWPNYDAYCEGMVVCVWRTGNGWAGGYFDYVGIGTTSKTCGINIITESYGGPASGGECGFFILSGDKKQRSNVLFTTWP